MSSYILSFQEINKTKLNVVGGKGANLGELARIEGVYVPDGFCLTTEAFKRIIDQAPAITELLGQLSLLNVDDRDKIATLSAEIRRRIEAVAIPVDISEEVTRQLTRFGENVAFAVRSSATAEDLPTASFAGQQDTYLNVIGKEAILKHISKCWASLYTERAIIYRIQTATSAVQFDHRNVQLAVVVQKMVFPQAAGILFTADPVNGNRTVLSIDASFGLGEALVAGLVNADTYKVRNNKIIDKQISAKELAIYAVKEGGTKEEAIDPKRQHSQALSDEQILQLAALGRKIEAHFGQPQDIEWCLVDDLFYIVQSRPITTLYPIPVEADEANPHVYLSVGHQQMMTDAMKPLGLTLWQFMAKAPMRSAGGRLFVDVAPMLASPVGRESILNVLGKFDPLITDALTTILERGDLIQPLPDSNEPSSGNRNQAAPLPNYQTLKDYEPTIVSELISRSETALAALKQTILTKSGSDLFDFIREDIGELKRGIPESFEVIMTAMNAASWINEKIEKWLGEKNVADTLSQSVSNNITSEMGLALLDVADVIRRYPAVIAYLRKATDDGFLEELLTIDGGPESCDAIQSFLDSYGMRCSGEIDITRPRWREKPTTLIPLILSNIKNFAPGESKRRFEYGEREAAAKKHELLERLNQLPDGEEKASETARMIGLIRNLAGYREYPKYNIISHYFVYKKALLKEAEQLVEAAVIPEKEDIYYLTFDEFNEVVQTHKLDYQLIKNRKDEYNYFEKLTPPRVLTSEGEVLTGSYKRANLPTNALIGLPVSSGVIEGRARVAVNLEDANLEDGDILITRFTDPSWTPLFVSIKGLVTEVGGLMTHGAVIAREYGLPAIVGMNNATNLIRDGQRIRLNGTDGYVELL